MVMKTTQKDQIIGFRVSPEFKGLIGAIAANERRSMSVMVSLFIEQGVKEYAKEHPEFQAQLEECLKEG